MGQNSAQQSEHILLIALDARLVEGVHRHQVSADGARLLEEIDHVAELMLVDHLKDIARDKRYWEEKRKKIHENEKRLDEVVEKYSQELHFAVRVPPVAAAG